MRKRKALVFGRSFDRRGPVTAVGFTSLGNQCYVCSGALSDFQEVRPSDRPYYYFNGKVYVPASLIYAGTTYLLLRFIAESLGLEVQWNKEHRP